MSRTLFDADLDPSPLSGRRVAVVGYGNQGRAHALNLRDTGIEVVVGARPGGRAEASAAEDGFSPASIEDAVDGSDLLALLLPDEVMADVWARCIAPRAKRDATLAFAHGFALQYRQVEPGLERDAILVAPVGPGRLLRSAFERGGGIPVVTAVHHDASGSARATALAYAQRLGGGKAGVFETTVEREVHTDLFGEQAVIVGGVCALMEAGFDTLVEAGYDPELAYFECIHQMKLLVDLVHERGMSGMREAISKTALYGDLTRGPRIVGPPSRRAMREVLAEVQSGAFAREWLDEVASGQAKLQVLLDEKAQHPSEAVRRRIAGRPDE